jgi:hypothetical protein
MKTEYRLTKIEVTNYKGIEHASFDVGAGGAIIQGRNGSGKTSLRDAILAALKARGLGPECVRNGADKAEILIDMDKTRVRRSITAAGGGAVTVVNEDGDKWGRPQSRLDELFGASLDPLAFFLAKPVDRLKMIMTAMPAAVTEEDVRRWTEDVRRWTDDLRAEANRRAKDARARADAAQGEAHRLVSDEHKGVVVPLPGEEDAPVREAERGLEALAARQRQAEEQERKAAGTRERIADLRKRAKAEDAKGLAPVGRDVMAALIKTRDEAQARVDGLKRELIAAEQAWMVANAAVLGASEKQRAHDESDAAAAALRAQAQDLESSLAAVAIEPPTAEERAQAETAVAQARSHRDLVRAARAAHDALITVAALTEEAGLAERTAADIDAIVVTLTKDAPAEVAARSQLIPGLAIDGDKITLDGKALDNLCGAEQMRFAVDLAKRLSPGGKLLTVNGLEQIDPDSRQDFYRLCMADGWQLIGTLVERGELRVVAIEAA